MDHTITSFIQSKRQAIAVLREQKAAVLEDAVTRGVNRDAPRIASKLEYLDCQPQHWRTTRLKFACEAIVDCLHATPDYLPDGVYPAIRTADVEPGRVRLEQARKISPEEFARWTARLRPGEGDILYSREGERFGIAAPVPKDVDLCVSQRMMVIRPSRTENSTYLMWQLNCRHVYQQAAADNVGSAAPHVNIDRIKNYSILLPPRHEQDAIVDHIGREVTAIDRAIALAEGEIRLIREYRIRLVVDAVSGHLDVRGLADRSFDGDAALGLLSDESLIDDDAALAQDELSA